GHQLKRGDIAAVQRDSIANMPAGFVEHQHSAVPRASTLCGDKQRVTQNILKVRAACEARSESMQRRDQRPIDLAGRDWLGVMRDCLLLGRATRGVGIMLVHYCGAVAMRDACRCDMPR